MRKRAIRILLYFSILFALVVEGLAIYAVNSLEKGFLEVYASEQDGLVKVILNQIDMLGDSADKDDITEIIATLDATASKYWTLSKGDNILFVKSITETNRYKNYNSRSYFSSESASEFVDSMRLDAVKHAIIELEDGRYIISGGVFSWNNEEYKICLLTYDKVIIEQNAILESRNSIIVHISIMIMVFMCAVVSLAHYSERKEKEISRGKEREHNMQLQIEKLINENKRNNAYDANNHVFSMMLLPEFLEKIDRKCICPLCFAYFEFDSKDMKEDFLMDLSIYMDRDVLRFDATELGVLLLLTGYTEERCRKILREANEWSLCLKQWKIFEDNFVPYSECFGQFWGGVKDEDRQII